MLVSGFFAGIAHAQRPIEKFSVTAVESSQISQFTAPKTPINLTLSPVVLNLETDPGVSITTAIRLRNNNTSPEQLEISVGTFLADTDGSKPKLIDAKPSDEFIKWLRVDQAPFVIQPGEWRTIPIEFAPPTDAALSYYYTLIVHRSFGATANDGDAAISGAPAELVLATVRSPNVRRELQVRSFKALHPVLEYLPQEFEVVIKNTGNVHLAPSGNIFIDGQGKKDIAVLSFNPTGSLVLPQTERTFVLKWDDGFPFFTSKTEGNKELRRADGQPVKTLSWDFSKADRFRLGSFDAHLLMVYDNGVRDVPIESSAQFWLIPWKIMVGIGLVLILALFGLISVGYNSFQLIREKKRNDNGK